MSNRVPVGVTRVEERHGNSRFIATIAHTGTMEAARAFVRSVREEMPDATHHVYAMRIGHGASVTEGVSDDGEPAGTSGPPVLAVLRGSGLGDAVIVITRYYGGTKLGTGGLVAAYGSAAKAVVAAAPCEEKIVRLPYRIVVEYGHYEFVARRLREAGALIQKEDFAEGVTILGALPQDQIASLTELLTDHCAGRISFNPLR